MKRTQLGTYFKTFLGQFKQWAEQFGIPYCSMGVTPIEQSQLTYFNRVYGNLPVFNEITFVSYVAVQSTKLGYGDFILLLRDNGRDLLAVELHDVTDTVMSFPDFG